MQIKGTCMGAIFAPNLAVLYMDDLENKRILFSDNPFHTAIALWKRYIDDIFMIWQDSDHLLSQFLHWLNNNCSGLQFTLCKDKHSIPFLDLNITHRGGVLFTSLYRKPAERNTLLSYSSHHPRALRDSLPYSQFLRIRRNCCLKEDYFHEAAHLSEKLSLRGYPRRLIRASLKRAWFCPREILLEPKLKKEQDRLVCVTTCNPVSNAIKKSIKKHWGVLNACTLHIEKPLFAFKKAKNIKDHLVRAALPTAITRGTLNDLWGLPPLLGHAKCGSCLACDNTIEGPNFVYQRITYKRQYFSNYATTNVIYAIRCPCDKIYVGQTTQKVKLRIGQHRSRICCKTLNAPLVYHFTTIGHTEQDFNWTIIAALKLPKRGGDMQQLLNKEELKWILKTDSINSGLNRQEDWTFLI